MLVGGGSIVCGAPSSSPEQHNECIYVPAGLGIFLVFSKCAIIYTTR